MSQAANVWFASTTILAVVAGPVIAVLITRWIDGRRAQENRQWQILRNLMQHRRTPMRVEFVQALNLVEIEFAKDTQVITAWKELLATFQVMVSDSTPQDQVNQLIEDRSRLQARLIDAIAKKLGLEVEQLDIYSGGYAPKGWFDMENEQTVIRRLFGEIALGRRAFPIELVGQE